MDLATTNLLLGIIAAVSLFEALALIAAGIGGYVLYRRVLTRVNDLERRQLAPLAARVQPSWTTSRE
jgi:hypothetical protein